MCTGAETAADFRLSSLSGWTFQVVTSLYETCTGANIYELMTIFHYVGKYFERCRMRLI